MINRNLERRIAKLENMLKRKNEELSPDEVEVLSTRIHDLLLSALEAANTGRDESNEYYKFSWSTVIGTLENAIDAVKDIDDQIKIHRRYLK